MTSLLSEGSTTPERAPSTTVVDDGSFGPEVGAVLLAVVGWVGADLAIPSLGGLAIGTAAGVLSAAALFVRSWPLLGVGVFILLSNAGASAAAAYKPVPTGSFDGRVTVLNDPRPAGSGWTVLVRLPSRDRVEAIGYGPAGWDLADMRIGQTHRLTGRLRGPGERRWLQVRHITGRLSVQDVSEPGQAGSRWLVSETFRGLVIDGASNMSERRRALYLGLVIGDDRFQPLGQRLRFRASGLTHLLAVSGQNVAFVLAVLGGPLRVLGRRSRLAITIAALVVFAIVTRLEPSVLRATATALLAVWASATGRERPGLMILSVAVLALLLIDPFLVDSIGFQLSVAASAGILLLQPALQRRIPGPVWVSSPLSTTAAAQLGVSPILGLYFGPVSLASIPANLLAGWAAGAVMTLGLSVGILAGITPTPVSSALQLPTVVLLSWIESVAAWHTNTPAPRFGPGSAIGLSILAMALLPARSVANRPASQAADGLVLRWMFVLLPGLLAAFLLAVSVPRAPSTIGPCGVGVTWYPSEGAAGSALVLSSAASARSIEQCMDAGIGSADLVISISGGRRASELVAALREVMDVSAVFAPPQHRILGAKRQLAPSVVPAGRADLLVTPTSDGTKLTVVEQPNS